MSSKHPLDAPQSQSLRKRPRHNANPSPLSSRPRAVKRPTSTGHSKTIMQTPHLYSASLILPLEETRCHKTQDLLSIFSDAPADNQTAPVQVLDAISIRSDGPEETKTARVKVLDVISIHSDGPAGLKTTKVGVLDVISIHSDGPAELKVTNAEPQVGLKNDDDEENDDGDDDDDQSSFEELRLAIMKSMYAVEAWRESVRDALGTNENAPDPNEEIESGVVAQSHASTRDIDLTIAQYHASNLSLTDLQELCRDLQERCYDLQQKLASVQERSNAGWLQFWSSDARRRDIALELAHAREEIHNANSAKERARLRAKYWKTMFTMTGEKMVGAWPSLP
ncbi:hypothetical protein K435DRAFT_854572 [Dendrothele bispora CBS 962.96]|uniref:Uncharacterized protein n=1 Tax=Dendrothele bispora (strain CBS 962.96) TaxID=1314807 RepID=A0A4S8ME23_DENBC|nr:hypothetical protein K435DRAFT_854572 [Dendrothele bispora CBS 962.96]